MQLVAAVGLRLLARTRLRHGGRRRLLRRWNGGRLLGIGRGTRIRDRGSHRCLRNRRGRWFARLWDDRYRWGRGRGED